MAKMLLFPSGLVIVLCAGSEECADDAVLCLLHDITFNTCIVLAPRDRHLITVRVGVTVEDSSIEQAMAALQI
jgi:hypothetical protein